MKTKLFTAQRSGMSLPELLIALAVFGIIVAGALGVMTSEMKTFSRGQEIMGALQNVRFAAGILEKDVSTTGTNVPLIQPYLVYADTSVLAFNADYMSDAYGDPFSVYNDSSAVTAAVDGLGKTRRMKIPTTSFYYPDTTYKAGTSTGYTTAETIIFWFASDTTTTRTDDFVLYRQANDQAPEIVSRNIEHITGMPFFQYVTRIQPASGAAYMDSIKASALPVKHSIPIHQALGDTGAVAIIDRVRGVRVNLLASNGRTGSAERTYRVNRLIDLPNAGTASPKTCGDEPFLGSSVSFTALNVLVGGIKTVKLSWMPATDEFSGEKDVIRYVIYRNLVAGQPFVDPYISIPAGASSYTWSDTNVNPMTTYYYAVAAQDCTPSLSTTATATVSVGP